MKIKSPTLAMSTLAVCSMLCLATPAWSQVAGATTTIDATITESTHPANGWSVKKTLLGKTIYNDAGKKVGKVDDLIISLNRNVSYVIVSAGGFVGIGRHDVAIPVSEIQDHSGKLVMAGANKESIRSRPEFKYSSDISKRDQFIAVADKDIAKGRAKVADLEKKAGVAAADAKTRIDQEISSLQGDLKNAEDKLTEMKQATVARWHEFEAGVSAATARLRKSVDIAAS